MQRNAAFGVLEGSLEGTKALAASDFFTVEVWSWSGLVTYYALFVMELATRKVCIAGITTHPDTPWMLQMARQRTDTVGGILLGKWYLILDRDTKYASAAAVP